MAIALYFEPAESAMARRLAVRLDTRRHLHYLSQGYTSVDLARCEAEHGVREVEGRVRAARKRIARLQRSLALPDGDRDGPSGSDQRDRWSAEQARLVQRLPRDEHLLANTERQLKMLDAVLAGEQNDNQLPPRPAPARRPVAPEEGDSASEQGESPVPDRVSEVARHLDYLNVPTELGRPKVRELLEFRDPTFRVGDAVLNQAIQARRSVASS
jgi:hypothetical protein